MSTPGNDSILPRRRASGRRAERVPRDVCCVDPTRERLAAFEAFTLGEIVLALKQDPCLVLPRQCTRRKQRMEAARQLSGIEHPKHVATHLSSAVAESLDPLQVSLEHGESHVGCCEPSKNLVLAAEAAGEQPLAGEVDPTLHRADLPERGAPLSFARMPQVVHRLERSGADAASNTPELGGLQMNSAAEAERLGMERLDHAISAVSAYWNVTADELLGESRKQHVAHPRFVVMALARDHFGLSLTAIARRFSREHSMVLRGCRTVAGLRKSDVTFDQQVIEIEKRLGISRKGSK